MNGTLCITLTPGKQRGLDHVVVSVGVHHLDKHFNLNSINICRVQ